MPATRRSSKDTAAAGTANAATAARRIALGGDHEGYRLKERLLMVLREDRYSVKDYGVHNQEPCDYTDIAEQVSRAVSSGEADLGIVVSGSGAGASLAAAKLPGIRAVNCQDTFTAQQTRRTLDANVLALGARVIGDDLAAEIARAWLATAYADDEKARRLRQRIDHFEEVFEDERQAARARTSQGRV